MHSTRPHLRTALALAVQLQHPAYDCVHLSLARHLDQPLVTADRQLVGAVRHRGLPDLDRLVLELSELPANL